MNAVEDTVQIPAEQSPSGQVPSGQIPDGHVTAGHITDGLVTGGPFADRLRAFAAETPIFAAMIAAWDGPAADIIAHRPGPGGDAGGEIGGGPATAEHAAPHGGNAEVPALRQLLSVDWEADRPEPVIAATGELNVATAGLLASPVRRALLGHPREVIVDLSGLAALSAAGLGALLELRRTAAAAGTRLTLRAPSPPVRDLLEVTGAGAEFAAGPR